MDNEELKEFSRCLSGLDDASKRLLLFKLVEMAYEGEEHTHVNVSPLVAYKMSSVTGCDVLCEIQTLVKYLKQLAVAQDYGSDILRDLTVYSAARLPAGMRRMHGGCTSRSLSWLYALPIDIAIASGSNARVTISPSDCLRYIGP